MAFYDELEAELKQSQTDGVKLVEAVYSINKPLDDSMRSNVIKHWKIYS